MLLWLNWTLTFIRTVDMKYGKWQQLKYGFQKTAFSTDIAIFAFFSHAL